MTRTLFILILVVCNFTTSINLCHAMRAAPVYDYSVDDFYQKYNSIASKIGESHLKMSEKPHYLKNIHEYKSMIYGIEATNLFYFSTDDSNKIQKIGFIIDAKDSDSSALVNLICFMALGMDKSEMQDIVDQLNSYKNGQYKGTTWSNSLGRYITCTLTENHQLRNGTFEITAYFKDDQSASNKNFSANSEVKIEYWNGDEDFPIWVLRDDKSMIAIRLSTARILDADFTEGRKLILFDAYDIETDGKITEHLIGPKGGYGLWYNQNTNYYMVFYPESRRFPEGKQIMIENPYQTKICKKLIQSAAKNPVFPFNPR